MQVYKIHGRGIFLRVFLQSVFFLSQALFYLKIFYQFGNGDWKWAKWLAGYAFGIYIVHEPFVVWCHYLLQTFSLGPIIKFIVTMILSLFLSLGILELVWQPVKRGGKRLWGKSTSSLQY